MNTQVQVGSAYCVKASRTCDIVLTPQPKLSDLVLNPTCGTDIHIYDPGTYLVSVTCEGNTIQHNLEVLVPKVIAEEAKYTLPPWLPLKPTWGEWIGASLVVLLGILACIWTIVWLFKKLKPKSVYEAPIKIPWSSDPYLREIRAIKAEVVKTSPKEAAFRLTRVLFDVSHTNPNRSDQAVFKRGYDESCVLFVNLKFNPSYMGNGTEDVVSLISQYEKALEQLKGR